MENNNNLENNGFENPGYDNGYPNNNFDNTGYDNSYQNNIPVDDHGYYNESYENQNLGNQNFENPDYDNGNYNQNFSGNEIDIPLTNDQGVSQYDASYTSNVDENFAESTENTLNSLGGELTDAEREDIRREKAAKKRKKMLREKRRRERQRQMMIRWGIFIAAIILVLFLIVKIFAGIGSLIKSAKHKKTTEEVTTEATTTEEPVAQIDESILAKDIPTTREKAMELLNAQAENDVDIKNIVENQAVYPDIVLEHLAVNSELIEFALHYPAQISVPFDGDFKIEDVNTSEVPLFLEYDSRWAYADYGTTVLGLNGDAPACLSMAYVYLTKDGSKNPIIVGDFSMEQGYLNESDVTDNKLMTEGATELGLEVTEIDIDKEALVSALNDGQVVVCAVNPGDFTKDKGYIVIRSFTNGFFYVNDPGSQARSAVGWDFKRLSSQISKMWAMKRGTASISTDDTDDASVDGTDAGNTDTDGTGDGSTDTDGTGDGSTGTDGTSDGSTDID